MPHFINQLTVIGIELGCAVPSIRHVSAPYLDDRGFWLDVDIDYCGGFCLSLETKCNLMRLKAATCIPLSCVSEESTVKLARFVFLCALCFTRSCQITVSSFTIYSPYIYFVHSTGLIIFLVHQVAQQSPKFFLSISFRSVSKDLNFS